jgi:hypothetical protein
VKRWLTLFGIIALAAVVVVLVGQHWDRARRMAELNEQMPISKDPGPVDVLVSEVVGKGDRLTERCLVVKQFSNDNGFALAYLSRNPHDESGKWHRRQIFGRLDDSKGKLKVLPPLFGYQFYDEPPGDGEIADFLETYMWVSDLRAHEEAILDGDQVTTVRYEPKLVRGTIHRKAWRSLLGREPPLDLFPEFDGQLVIE